MKNQRCLWLPSFRVYSSINRTPGAIGYVGYPS